MESIHAGRYFSTLYTGTMMLTIGFSRGMATFPFCLFQFQYNIPPCHMQQICNNQMVPDVKISAFSRAISRSISAMRLKGVIR